MSFYERFEALCLENGIDPTRIGQFIWVNGTPISSSTVSGWKNGAAPRNATVKALSDYFRVPVTYFSEDKEPEKVTKPGDCELCPRKDECSCILSAQELELVRKFRSCSESGKMALIYELMKIWNQEPGR